jgi:hypothetical protein
VWFCAGDVGTFVPPANGGTVSVSFARPKSRILMRPSAVRKTFSRLQIAMDDAAVVRCREPVRDLYVRIQSLCAREPVRASSRSRSVFPFQQL